MASERGPIWDGIQQDGFYDAKKEESAQLFCQQNSDYSYKQYNSKSKGMIFRIAPHDYFPAFEQSLQQNQKPAPQQTEYVDQTAKDIQQAFNAMSEAAQAAGKEKMEQDMANQGYVDYRKPAAAQLHQEKYPEHKMETLTDESGNTFYRFTVASKLSRLQKMSGWFKSKDKGWIQVDDSKHEVIDYKQRLRDSLSDAEWECPNCKTVNHIEEPYCNNCATDNPMLDGKIKI